MLSLGSKEQQLGPLEEFMNSHRLCGYGHDHMLKSKSNFVPSEENKQKRNHASYAKSLRRLADSPAEWPVDLGERLLCQRIHQNNEQHGPGKGGKSSPPINNINITSKNY